jgi:hypothetical protein
MGNAMNRRMIDVIPNHIKSVFELNDIPKVFDVLEDYFHTSKNWRKGYEQAVKNAPRSYDEREIFAKYLKENLDESLQKITQRKDSLIFAIMTHVVKDKIEEKRKEQMRYKK